jgi:hypothetical protein
MNAAKSSRMLSNAISAHQEVATACPLFGKEVIAGAEKEGRIDHLGVHD